MDTSDDTLEPELERMQQLLELTGERVMRHIATLPHQRASDTSELQPIVELVREQLPEDGERYETLLDLVFERLLPKGFNTASGGALSYVTGGGLFHTALADLIAAATNPYVAYWGASPGLAELEHTVVRWCRDIVGMPPTADGVLLSGGSTANLSALITARTAKLGQDFSRGVLYASDQVHHSIKKAALLAGFAEDALRVLPTDDTYRLRMDALTEAVARDRRAGLQPFCIVGTAGSTNTGAVDPLPELADFAGREDLWLHLDAAYGGFFALTERGRQALTGMERADSIVLDPHKSLFLPFGTGCLLARDVDTLRRAHQLHSDYIHAATELGEEAGALNFGDISPEMSRGMRGLKIWLPMKLLGAGAFRRALDEKLDLARWACDAVEQLDGFEVVARPQLSIFAFRAVRKNLDSAELDALNRRVLERVNARGRVHLSATRLDDRFTLRICILSFRTHRPHVTACLQDLTEALSAEGVY